MRTLWKRELQGYFHTATGYLFVGVFLLISSVLYYLQILRPRSGDLPAFLSQLCYLWMLLSPLLTMRLMAEEKQKQTDQLLLTSPVSLPAIVCGKYLAATTVLLLTAALTLPFVLISALYGTVYPAELSVCYLGFLLQGCAFAALDLYLSACAATPMAAAAAAFGANFLLWVLDLAETSVQSPFLSSVLRFFSLYRQTEPFLMGQLSFASLLFDFAFIAAFLILTVFHVDRKRWGGKVRPGRLRYGSVSAAMLALLLCALTALSLGAQALEKNKGWRVDLSFNSITSQAPETVEILKGLKTPVHIWALYRKGDEDAPLFELLDRYTAASSQITWEQTDPTLNPALLARFTTAAEAPTSDSLIVHCEETGRFRLLTAADFVSVSVDPETGEYAYAGWTYERSLTGAISYVTRERIPQAVIVQGHGELDGEALADFVSLLENNNYEVVWQDLTQDYTPDPADLLIFFSPLRDLTQAELDKLTAFAARGGSFLFTCDYTDPLSDMPRYASLLRSYGIEPLEGIVLADPDAADTYYSGNPVFLLPELCPTDLTLDLIASGADHLLFPGARAFAGGEETDRNLTVLSLVQSGETSYLKSLASGTDNLSRTPQDPQQSFPLALQARRVTTEGYISRAVAVGCSAALTDAQLYAMTDAQPFLIRTLEFLLRLDAQDLNILARTALRPGLSPGSATLGSVLLCALPLSVLFAALLILVPRRRR